MDARLIAVASPIFFVLIFLEISEILWEPHARHISIAAALSIRPALAAPFVAGIVFVLIALRIRQRHEIRIAGQMIMLYGLLWLIVYDVTFAAGYVDLVSAAVLLMLLPVAYGAVQTMRWWGRIVSLSQRPEFKRAET